MLTKASLVAQMVKHLPTMQVDPSLIPGLGRSSGEGSGNPLLPGKSHGQRSLVGYSLWGRKESDTTERLHFFSFFRSLIVYCRGKPNSMC